MKLNSNIHIITSPTVFARSRRKQSPKGKKKEKRKKKKKKNGTKSDRSSWIEQEDGEKRKGAESKPSSLLRYIVLAGYEARTSGSHTRFCVKRERASVHTTNEYNEYRYTACARARVH